VFGPASRYRGVDTALLARDGEPPVPYLRRRFVPQPEAQSTLAVHVVTQGQRLDNVTAFYLGDPTLFWTVCDANRAMRPDELTSEAGRRLRIPAPGAV
jgi:hypothetical protein